MKKRMPIIVILDLDHCLIHYLKPDEFDIVQGPGGHKDAAETYYTTEKNTIAIRKYCAHLIRSLKSLGVLLEIVTQNLEGESILNTLISEDFDTWRNIPLTVVQARSQHSKQLENTKTFQKYLQEGFSLKDLRDFTMILDDQENCWCKDDYNNVLEVAKFDLVGEIKPTEYTYLRGIFETDLLSFFGEKNEENFELLEKQLA